jgi:hypothetical protein
MYNFFEHLIFINSVSINGEGHTISRHTSIDVQSFQFYNKNLLYELAHGKDPLDIDPF